LIVIHEIEYEDIDKGFLQVLDNLLPTNIDVTHAKEILEKIKSNPLHKIFVAEDTDSHKIVGTATLLLEPKFIDKGMVVGYVEDVAVKKGYEGQGIGKQVIANVINYAKTIEHCSKILLYCSEKTKKFYEKSGFQLSEEALVMKMKLGDLDLSTSSI
jgi:glucosamine-phosphate N-acetyltransferase